MIIILMDQQYDMNSLKKISFWRNYFALFIIVEDLKAKVNNLLCKECIVIEVLAMISNCKKITYKNLKLSLYINHEGMPEVSLRSI